MKNLFLFLIFLTLSSTAVKAQQTKLLTGERHNDYGLVYTLPTTALKVEIVAVKETRVAGPYSNYAKIFTSEDKVIAKNEVVWTIESAVITPFGIEDSENRYVMQLKPGALTYICVADDNMLQAINKDVKYEEPESLDITTLEGTVNSGKEYLEFVNEDFVAATSSYKQAQILAEELMEIREAKISLTRGTAETMPTDGRQLEIMLESLQNQEKALMQAFTGSSWKERIVRSFTFVPEKEGRSVICKLIANEGIVDASAKSGEPLYISISEIEEAELPTDAKGETKKIPKDAVMYTIPGNADVTLSYGKNILAQDNFSFSQFGMTFGLNPSIFTDKKEPSYAVFDPATGALLELGTLK